MASEQHDTVLPEEDQDLDEDEESSEDDDLEENDDVLADEEEDDDEEDLNSASTTAVATPAITVAFPSSSVSATTVTVALPPSVIDEPDPKRQRVDEGVTVQEERKPLPQQLDESRRLFQRLWTDEDEIELLQGFLDYSTQRGNAHHLDTALFYDQIKSKLQLDFNKNQLVEKLRRLKKKYRNVVNKISSGKDFSFKTAHDQATFEISRKIWSNNNTANVSVLDDEEANHNNNNLVVSHEVKTNNYGLINSNNNEEKVTPKSRKRSRSKTVGNDNINAGLINNSEILNVNSGGRNGIAGVVEETVRSCLSPLFRELLHNAMGGVGGRGTGGLTVNAVMPLGFGGTGMGMGMMGFGGSGGGGEVVDEKWRKQQILELEVYSKRLELVQEQIKVALEELRSMGG
ncbi:DNA-binding storekeeper protein-related transcriptional regulator [Melia azedarach]|uniref:DNA-binding storekeeper protein-related transcriptional regulator n=1 Tax=Melia azedarach TaxID=155640 RepID=A0ACC1Y8K4_MELAZ|nr:DNA-binding storekeeper protein-related transcriptional regulator [Melia azedarach]